MHKTGAPPNGYTSGMNTARLDPPRTLHPRRPGGQRKQPRVAGSRVDPAMGSSKMLIAVMSVSNPIGVNLLAPVIPREPGSYLARLRSGEIRNDRVLPREQHA